VAYIGGLIITGLFFLALHYFTELTKSQKLAISTIVLLIIVSAILYNNFMAQQRDKILNVVTIFNQGKTIHCNGVEVNKDLYTLSIGTFTFIGKENTPIYGQMISASTCE
jgi:energy-coupling factor transporter transmembrane protein EcfT